MFDDFAALAAKLCSAAMAQISLFDGGSLTVKATWPVPAAEESIAHVPLFDETELSNGAQLFETADGLAVGVLLLGATGRRWGILSVVDPTVRGLTDDQRSDLGRLVRQMVGQLELMDQARRPAARNANEQSEERWRALVEHSPVAVAVIGNDGSFLYANPVAKAMFGLPASEHIQGRASIDYVPAEDQDAVVTLFRELISGGPPLLGHRWRLRQQDGAVLIVETNAVGVMYRGAPAVQMELRNMTEKAEAEDALRDSEHRFHSVFNGSPIAMALSDERGLWVEANAAFGHLLGVDPAEMIGKAAQCYAHPDDHALIAHSEQGQLDSPDGVHRLEIRFLRPDGETRWAWITITPTPGPRGRIWTLAIAQDVTARKAAEDALRESEADLAAIAAVARCVQDGEDPRPIVVRTVLELSRASTVCLFESSGPDTLVATAAEGADVMGFSISLSDPSMTAQVWRSGEAAFLADARDHPNVSRLLLALDNTVSVLWQPVIVHGKVEAVLNVTWRRRIDDPGERAVRAVKVIADEAGISLNAKRLHLELERFALTDPLTGSLNRRAWDVRIHEMIDQISHGDGVGNPNSHGIEIGSLTIALIDLDHFKAYNDTYGHAAGDMLLREFAEAAGGCLRKTDVFARWGGEEFIIAMPDTNAAEAAEILDRVRACVPLGSTCSVGHTSWRPHETVSACIARADSALYEAKQAGRNCLAAR